jgi:4,5-DOPA dioxygenase extradiol
VTTHLARMPAVFIGHGSPMNALEANVFTDAWRALGKSLPRPRAILSISAHWYTSGAFVSANEVPRTIHDFAGFPAALFEMRYAAPGDPALAARVVELLSPDTVRPSIDWGLDHGTWSVLVHAYPTADIPVVQLSIDGTQAAAVHYALGQRLAPLRDEGILLLGSGGIVHNLARVDWSNASRPPPWAVDFDERVRARLRAGDDAALVRYEQLGDGARLSVPTPEHYLPLLYVLGSRLPGDVVTIPLTGFELGSISMTAVVLGAA